MPLRKVSRCHQDVIEILFKVADKLQLCDIEYDVKFGSEDIDMFISGLYKICLKGTKCGQRVKYSVIVKWHEDPERRKYLRKLYIREHAFFRYVQPQLLDVQRSFSIIEGLKMKFKNYILLNDEYDKETVVVFDIFQQGYLIQNRFYKTDFTHASLVMRNFAKLHALTFTLERTRPKVFKEIKRLFEKDVQYSDPDCMSKSMQCCYNASVSVVTNPVAKETLKVLGPNISHVLNKCTKPGPYSVICHADCWYNNLFFKYQGGKPVDVIFIDYQLCRLASPVTDLSYYLYMSCERDFLIEHYHRLLDIYYGTLSGVLRCCDLNVEDVYPKDVFRENLKQFSVLGLIEALVSMRIITAAAEEAFEMTELKYYTEDGLCRKVTQNQDLYVNRVNGVVDDFFERGYSVDYFLGK